MTPSTTPITIKYIKLLSHSDKEPKNKISFEKIE